MPKASPFHVDPGTTEFDDNPTACYEQVREHGDPFWWGEGNAWFLTSYASILEAAVDDERFAFSSKDIPGVEPGVPKTRFEGLFFASFFGVKRSDHRRLRQSVVEAFTPAAVGIQKPLIATRINDTFDNLDYGHPIEWVSAVAGTIPAPTLATAIGIPGPLMSEFCLLASDAARMAGAIDSPTEAEVVHRAVLTLADLSDSCVKERLSDEHIRNPSTNLLDRLAEAHLAGDLTLDEIAALVITIIVAGTETTRHLLSNIGLLAATCPDVIDSVRCDPTRASRVVDELLRWSPIAKGLKRWATNDDDINGTPIERGDTLYLPFGAANNDPAVFACPEQFDPSRPNLPDHLAFGAGPHRCLGANLARLQATTLLHAVALRTTSITLTGEPKWLGHPATRGLARLDLTITPRETPPSAPHRFAR